VFHARRNLHPLILFDANQPGQFDLAEQFGAAILALCVEVGGTHHRRARGRRREDRFDVRAVSRAELDLFLSLKHAFDPASLLNPGKAIPSLHRCAEHGRMHVQHGKLPFADLPRF